jgi:hypothetical protein
MRRGVGRYSSSNTGESLDEPGQEFLRNASTGQSSGRHQDQRTREVRPIRCELDGDGCAERMAYKVGLRYAEAIQRVCDYFGECGQRAVADIFSRSAVAGQVDGYNRRDRAQGFEVDQPVVQVA